MLSVTIKSMMLSAIMPNVIMLNVIMLNVAAPMYECQVIRSAEPDTPNVTPLG